MFKAIDPGHARPTVRILLDGIVVDLPAGVSLAAGLLFRGKFPNRASPVHEIDGQKSRAPYCMMGVCFECLVTVDGKPNQQSCLLPVRGGMIVERQGGAADLLRASEREGGPK
ncbi:(2Fe-2S)-binding protein [Algicella marina]|uniref:(2Fe-2S)-binding protein n=1 Tax=Algicella marina TaxID=2683284 RepID=A0A6P1T1T1_9RHOB|nr:(2Fe-2S)-binding protein [Algicella marina]QHQ35426.1 (2Fe-2S)-binding protein [Algicella marina]